MPKKAALPKPAVKPAAAVPHVHPGNGSNNPDTKPAIKQFIQSPNRSSRNGQAINKVVLHCTEASLSSTIKTFKDSSPTGRQVSAHYVIDRNGDIYQMVADSERANHCKGANAASIGIEHVATAVQALTAAQSAASAKLVRWLLQQYDIPSTQVYGHDFTPGYTGGGTSCPDALFGAHSQQAVQNWVNANVVSGAPAGAGIAGAAPAAAAAPPAGSKLKCTVDSLNVRLSPSLQGGVIGSLNNGDVVDWLDTSADQKWAKVQKGTLTGWSSRRFLVDPGVAAPQPGQGSTLADILTMAGTSAIAHFDWPDRGVAPQGYIKGMAAVYARMYCKLKAGDAVAVELARANSGDTASDALAHYAHQFQQAGMDNESSGVATLRHLFVLMIGLGMRESSGRYCEGRDRGANNTAGDTAEAGMLQTSFNARKDTHEQPIPLMLPVYEDYKARFAADPKVGFIDIFKEGVTALPRDLKNWGAGEGVVFQQLSKECPAFTVEFSGLGLRHNRRHWGPINTRAAELRPEANQMLMRVEQIVDNGNLCPL